MGFLKTIAVAFAAFSAVDAARLLSVPDNKDVIKDAYIVVMKDSISSLDFDSHISWANNLHHEGVAKRGSTSVGGFKHAYRINGWHAYSGSFDRETLDEILKNDNVAYVEHDRRVYANAFVTQKNAPSWGLARISNKKRDQKDFIYDENAGEGVTIYGVDTGIDIRHPDFGGRAVWGINIAGGGDNDVHGHGTHTAGTFGGTNYGIAKKSKIVAVKALNDKGAGTWSGIIQGINWCVDHARMNNALGKAVMNLSLGGGKMESANQACTAAVKAGIFLSVAAGNENQDALKTSPASAADVCVVGASTFQDIKAYFSNWGPRVNIYAPGSGIISAAPGNTTKELSGTSQAAPHVAGVGATLIGSKGIAPSAVCAEIVKIANGPIYMPGTGTTNKLLYNGSGQ
uniref:Alkaline serine protease n=1 Tax=Onygena corvina TaxID=180788 RepID=A0A0B4VM19_9EURO|nr:alkaline serine protease [Onygena corvina]